jgi:hypothetical protein
MRIIRDNQYVRERQKRSKYSAILGFLALVGTFPVAFLMQGNTGFVLFTYMLLLGGFVLFNRGMRGVGKWSNNQRHVREDLALDNHLSDLSDRHTLIHYAQVEGGVIDHMLVGPGGVIVLTTTDFPGPVEVTDDRWRKSGPMLTRMFTFSGPQLGSPTREADKDFSLVEAMLNTHGHDVDIYTAIVFTAGTADLTVNGASHPVMPVDELPHFVKDVEPDPGFSSTEREAVITLFSGQGQVEAPVKTSTRRPVKVKKRAA